MWCQTLTQGSQPLFPDVKAKKNYIYNILILNELLKCKLFIWLWMIFVCLYRFYVVL